MQVTLVQRQDLFARVIERAVIEDDVVRDGEPLGSARLSGKHPPRLVFGFGVPGQQPRHKGTLVAIHDQYQFHEVPERRFNQQRHDDDMVAASGGTGLFPGSLADPRVQY